MIKLYVKMKLIKVTKLNCIRGYFVRQLSIHHVNNDKKKDCKHEDKCKVAPTKCQSESSSEDDCITPPSMVDPCLKLPKIVIVGAGMAGLSAAQRLASSGLTDFTVLEATDRPGGRIHSCWMGDVVAEMGAQWIYGSCITNPIFSLACQENLIKSPIYRYDQYSGLCQTSDGRAIERMIGINAYQTFKQIEHQAYSLFSLGSGRDHGTLMNFFNIRIQQELQNFPENQRCDVARVMFGLTNCVRNRWGTDVTQMSADQFGSFIEIPGGDTRIPKGYVGVLAPLIREIPDCNIKYCKPVKSICWATTGENAPRAIVKCCDGDDFPADFVIVTVSLGVLKAQADKLFNPSLPEEKLEAIKKLGFGCINKIFMEYSRPFWVWREGDINLAWSMDEINEHSEWVKALSSIKEMPGSQHILQADIAGTEAANVENLSDKEIAETLTKLLRQFTGDPTLPFPVSILKSKWSSDPHFAGASSFMGLESTVGHQCDLGSPLPGTCDPNAPILLFAGEATCPGHFSTVQGARYSGIREAERVIQLTKQKACENKQHQKEKVEACS